MRVVPRILPETPADIAPIQKLDPSLLFISSPYTMYTTLCLLFSVLDTKTVIPHRMLNPPYYSQWLFTVKCQQSQCCYIMCIFLLIQSDFGLNPCHKSLRDSVKLPINMPRFYHCKTKASSGSIHLQIIWITKTTLDAVSDFVSVWLWYVDTKSCEQSINSDGKGFGPS